MLRARKGVLLPSLCLTQFLAVWIPADISDTLKMVLRAMERVDFHELLSLPLEMLICKARGLVVLSQTETVRFPKKDWGCHQLKCLITCRGRVNPEARMTFFPVLWLVCVALLVFPLEFQKTN